MTLEQRSEFKKEVSDYVVEQLLEDTSKGLSSVTGKRWKGLNKKSPYINQKREEAGNTKANLELTGEMLDALKAEIYRDGIEVGFFDSEQAQKADNHNKFSAKSRKTPLPKRQSIPNNKSGQNFRSGIMKEIIEIAREFTDDD